jgi:Serine carboxypeptidase
LYILKRMQINACNSLAGTDAVCSDAQDFCNTLILQPLSGDWDPYYVPAKFPDPYPPQLNTYLHNSVVTSKIGSRTPWLETNYPGVYNKFAATGDWMRSARPALEEVINNGVRTVIYAGDADYIVNYIGVEAMVRARVLSFSPTPFRVSRPLH